MFGNAQEQKLGIRLLGNPGQTATGTDMLSFVKPSGKAMNYILPFLLSYSSFLDGGLVPSIGELVASSLIEGESGVTVLLVNAGKVREKTKINLDEQNPGATKL